MLLTHFDVLNSNISIKVNPKLMRTTSGGWLLKMLLLFSIVMVHWSNFELFTQTILDHVKGASILVEVLSRIAAALYHFCSKIKVNSVWPGIIINATMFFFIHKLTLWYVRVTHEQIYEEYIVVQTTLNWISSSIETNLKSSSKTTGSVASMRCWQHIS